MQQRGRSFLYEAFYPAGTSETLLDVPRYDFNWQLRYELAAPKRMPAGTRLLCAGHFDNSSDNLANPDPDQAIEFGWQTWEEMMTGFFTAVVLDEPAPYAPRASAKADGAKAGG